MAEKIEKKRYINMDGKVIPYDEAKVHPLNMGMKFGAQVFDATRIYWNEDQKEMYIFRIREHLKRLHQSARICRMLSPYTIEEWIKQIQELVRANDCKEDLHCRIMMWVNKIDGQMFECSPIGTLINVVPWPESAKPYHVCVSSWGRIADFDVPPRVKAAANYHHARLGGLQAVADGYENCVFLDRNGRVTEMTGACVFMIRNGIILTPPVTSGILESITRDAILTLSAEVTGKDVVQREIDRTELYIADEAFCCGSGAEVRPICSIDKHPVGDGKMGPITQKIREAYMNAVRGKSPEHRDWLTPVYGK